MKIYFHYLIATLIVLGITSAHGAITNMSDMKKLDSLHLKIRQVGDPVLRRVADPLTKEEIGDPKIQNLIHLMKNTMRHAPGVGLAAPQIGIPLQIAVIEDREKYLTFLTPEQIKERDRHPVPFQVLINPRITILASSKQKEFYEGCLSLEGYVASVPRALEVQVEALNEQGEPITIEAKGWYARILQHEIDHLNGTLYIDRMDSKTLTNIENYKKFGS